MRSSQDGRTGPGPRRVSRVLAHFVARKREREIARRYGPAQRAEGFEIDRLMAVGRPTFTALTDPPFVAARDVSVPPNQLSLAINMEGETKIYPLPMLVKPHIVNDRLGSRRILVTFCSKCMSGLCFDPVVDDRQLTFHELGLYQGNLVMRDEQSQSLWGQLTGDALAGPLVGHRLEWLPSEMTEWGAWLHRYPDALTPDPAHVGVARFSERNVSFGAAVRGTIVHHDARLQPETLVLGVDVGERSVAYILDPSLRGPAVYQDQIDDLPIALIASPGAWPNAFDRRLDGTVVDLVKDDGGSIVGMGSTWNSSGQAIDGPRVGQTLPVVPSRITRWHAWGAYRTGTEIRDLASDSAPER